MALMQIRLPCLLAVDPYGGVACTIIYLISNVSESFICISVMDWPGMKNLSVNCFARSLLSPLMVTDSVHLHAPPFV